MKRALVIFILMLGIAIVFQKAFENVYYHSDREVINSISMAGQKTIAQK